MIVKHLHVKDVNLTITVHFISKIPWTVEVMFSLTKTQVASTPHTTQLGSSKIAASDQTKEITVENNSEQIADSQKFHTNVFDSMLTTNEVLLSTTTVLLEDKFGKFPNSNTLLDSAKQI